MARRLRLGVGTRFGTQCGIRLETRLDTRFETHLDTRLGARLTTSLSTRIRRVFAVGLAVLSTASLLGACGKSAQDEKAEASKRTGPPATLITVAKAERRPLEVTESSIGTLENVIDPRVGAEVAGKVVRVLAAQGQTVRRGQLLAEIDGQEFVIQGRTDDAEIARLVSLVGQQDRFVERQQQLVQQGFISQNAVDDAIAQRNALREQLSSARSKGDSTKNTLRKTRVIAPIDGRVQDQIVTEGDFVKIGDPLFQLIGTQSLVAHLPFPESALSKIKIGMVVRITSPLAPDLVINAKVDDIRPAVTASSRSIDVIVKFATDERMRGGGTVNAAIVTARRPEVVVVPEQAVVLRPAGKVVYLVVEGRAEQRVVETGYKTGGMVEIVKGLQGGELVALDGAGFLTDGAPIALPKPAAGKGGAGKGGKDSGGKDGGSKGESAKGAPPASDSTSAKGSKS